MAILDNLAAIWAMEDLLTRIQRHRLDPFKYQMPTVKEYLAVGVDCDNAVIDLIKNDTGNKPA